MSNLEDLRAKQSELSDQIGAIEQALRQEENSELVGRYFKYDNGYSLKDRWLMYFKVVACEHGHPIAIAFQTDTEGKITIEKGAQYLIDDCEEITEMEYSLQWDTCMAKIQEMAP